MEKCKYCKKNTKEVWNGKCEECKMFRSTDEYLFAIALDKLNIKYEYEKHTIQLIEPYEKIRGNKYTPDFVFEYKGRVLVIEVKGFTRGGNVLTNKLARIEFAKRGYEYYVIKLAGTIKDNNKDFYIYGKKPNSTAKKWKTFWEVAEIDV